MNGLATEACDGAPRCWPICKLARRKRKIEAVDIREVVVEVQKMAKERHETLKAPAAKAVPIAARRSPHDTPGRREKESKEGLWKGGTEQKVFK